MGFGILFLAINEYRKPLIIFKPGRYAALRGGGS